MARAYITACTTVVLPLVAIPTIYLFYLQWTVSRNTTSSTGRRTRQTAESPVASDSLPWTPRSLPIDVTSECSQWVLAYERVVSKRVPISTLAVPVADALDSTSLDRPVSDLMRAYSQATQGAFSWTPQAFAIRAAISEDQYRRTFDTDWIQGLSFEDGDVVNGVYKVVYHGNGSVAASERVELALEPPPSYKGPPVNGLIVTQVESADLLEGDAPKNGGQEGDVVFVNETWMWRREDEKPTLLETPIGTWLHTLLAGWLVGKGIQAVTREDRKRQ